MWKAKAAVENTTYGTVVGAVESVYNYVMMDAEKQFEAASLHFQSRRERLGLDSSMEWTETFSVRSVTQQACIY